MLWTEKLILVTHYTVLIILCYLIMIIVCFEILGCRLYDTDQESISFSIQKIYLGLPGVVGVI